LHPLRALNDESGQILAQVVKVGIIVLVLAFLIVEVGPIIYARITIINDAEDVAMGAAFTYRMTRSQPNTITDAGDRMKLMGYSDEEIRESTVELLPIDSPDKMTVRVTVVKYASTLITRHISYLKRFARISKTAEANIATATSPGK
jgi:hypothetical protein